MFLLIAMYAEEADLELQRSKNIILYIHKLITIILILGCLFWDNKHPRTFLISQEGMSHVA